ncbi:NosD domain-containing protein [Naasia sp. SYSU D00948]|uniref:NosD domain-containing protein n=1 Tax=Naasia sp. SYSU D00948 TaxID=2817379 RepID=UPI001B3113B5|nr:NosD domain-containing protein [Naasia sp. SYSU D00948]
MRTSAAAAVTAALVLTGALSASPAQAAPPAGVEITCGATIASDAYLARNLTCTEGVTVTAGAVLDLNGKTLAGADGGTVAITVDSPADVHVVDGRISGWGVGASNFGTGGRTNVSGVAFTGNGTAYTFIGAGGDIVDSRFEDNAVAMSGLFGIVSVDSSVFRNNTEGMSLSGGGYMGIRDSRFSGNGSAVGASEGSFDIYTSTFEGNDTAIRGWWTGGTIEGNRFAGNGTALHATTFTGSGYDIVGNVFTKNTIGIYTEDNVTLTGNEFTQNGTALKSGPYHEDDFHIFIPIARLDGNYFARNGDAVLLEIPSELKETTAIRNSGYGIYAPRATDLGGNVAYGNGIEPQCTGVVCAGR